MTLHTGLAFCFSYLGPQEPHGICLTLLEPNIKLPIARLAQTQLEILAQVHIPSRTEIPGVQPRWPELRNRQAVNTGTSVW